MTLSLDAAREERLRKLRRHTVNATIVWLDEPVILGEEGKVRVVGVALDASDETLAEYGIARPLPVLPKVNDQGGRSHEQRTRSRGRRRERVRSSR